MISSHHVIDMDEQGFRWKALVSFGLGVVLGLIAVMLYFVKVGEIFFKMLSHGA